MFTVLTQLGSVRCCRLDHAVRLLGVIAALASAARGADYVYTITLSPDGSTAYIVKPSRKTLSIVDLETDTITDLPFADAPQAVTFSADGGLAYVTTLRKSVAGTDESVPSPTVVLDTATYAVVGTVPATYSYVPPPRPVTAAVASGCWGLFDTPTALPTLTPTPRRTPTFTRAPTVPRLPTPTPGGAQTPVTTREYVYIANEGAGVVSVVDPANAAVVATIPVGIRPTSVAVQPDGTLVYVAGTYTSAGLNVLRSLSVLAAIDPRAIGCIRHSRTFVRTSPAQPSSSVAESMETPGTPRMSASPSPHWPPTRRRSLGVRPSWDSARRVCRSVRTARSYT